MMALCQYNGEVNDVWVVNEIQHQQLMYRCVCACAAWCRAVRKLQTKNLPEPDPNVTRRMTFSAATTQIPRWLRSLQTVFTLWQNLLRLWPSIHMEQCLAHLVVNITVSVCIPLPLVCCACAIQTHPVLWKGIGIFCRPYQYYWHGLKKYSCDDTRWWEAFLFRMLRVIKEVFYSCTQVHRKPGA